MKKISIPVRKYQLKQIKNRCCKICGKKNNNKRSKILCLKHLLEQNKINRKSYLKRREYEIERSRIWRAEHPFWWRKYKK